MEQSKEFADPGISFSIELINGMEAIRELYYSGGRGSIFTYKPTRTVLVTSSIFILLSGICYLFSLSNKVEWVVLFVVNVIMALFFLFRFSQVAKKYFQWMKGVDEYLKKLSKYEKQTLTLYHNSFELSNSDETVIEKWTNIRKTSFLSSHITLNSATGTLYLFPAKSMKDSEYEYLKEFIGLRMKDSTAIEDGKKSDDPAG